ncbi:hypothetical protein J1N10_07710 [Carboxylicivirga sp. A043]|uniref:glycoside hydrolase family 2 TIM barrel-domain containing protein n=1 Tax=Carboxylicivirga litoralis TaxID=2816963 RepID=UPI0021CB495F|nr:glycoside hydrolase family 2 TIM barrel-domain containing protein [Carboxylicivirga sp. A043]MCU4155860.1 hypothetical protein [Carboxylicivirga sp. A043]
MRKKSFGTKRIVSFLGLLLFALLDGSVYAQRQEFTINSSWQFTLDCEPSMSETVNLPHTWNAQDAFTDKGHYYRGKGTYEKELFIPNEWQNKRLFIRFEGANQSTRLWLNKQLVGEHHGGYTGFVFELSDYIRTGEDNELMIEVDNRHNPDIPPLEADFNFYGGVYRDVSLIVSNSVHFDLASEAAGNFLIQTPEVTADKAEFQVESVLVNGSKSKRGVQIKLNIFNPQGEILKTLSQERKLSAGSQNSIRFSDFIQNPALWSPEHPHLYKAELTVTDKKTGQQLDEMSSSFGCRWFSIDAEEGFFLNGKPLKLIGVNRHQDYPVLGNALPNALHRKDYELIKEMGSNFVRIAHYPHDPDVYRLCDELGLLAWSEIPIINEITNSTTFTNNCLQMQREHIMQFFNHPSVVMWGYMNEIFLRMVFNRKLTDDDKEQIIATTVELAQQLDDETRRLDPDRLTAMALHNNQVYNTTGIADIPDVIGWNLYFGWYDATLDDLGAFLDKEHKRYPKRPILITEYGPGADTRIHTENPKPWDYSEAYQLKSHQSYYRQVMERPFVAGMTAWNFADFGSAGRQDTRPRINQKGLLNFDRTDKNVYHYYQALLLETPFVYMERHNPGQYFCDADSDGNGQLLLHVFSNQPNVELLVDDSQILNQAVKDGITEFQLTLPIGHHILKAKAGAVSDQYNLDVYSRSSLNQLIDKQAVCVNVGSHCDYYDPLTKEIWVHDQSYTKGEWGHVGGTVYQRNKQKFQGTAINITGTDNDPLFQTMQEGLSEYRFDVADGSYRVTLLLTEPNLKASSSLIYNLTDETDELAADLRIFDVLVNGHMVLYNLNMARDFGAAHAVAISFEAKVQNGLVIGFENKAGQAVLSGIKVEKIR